MSLAFPSREEGGLFLVHMISTCLRGRRLREGDGESASCGSKLPLNIYKHGYLLRRIDLFWLAFFFIHCK
jgi:hypothetical protein